MASANGGGGMGGDPQIHVTAPASERARSPEGGKKTVMRKVVKKRVINPGSTFKSTYSTQDLAGGSQGASGAGGYAASVSASPDRPQGGRRVSAAEEAIDIALRQQKMAKQARRRRSPPKGERGERMESMGGANDDPNALTLNRLQQNSEQHRDGQGDYSTQALQAATQLPPTPGVPHGGAGGYQSLSQHGSAVLSPLSTRVGSVSPSPRAASPAGADRNWDTQSNQSKQSRRSSVGSMASRASTVRRVLRPKVDSERIMAKLADEGTFTLPDLFDLRSGYTSPAVVGYLLQSNHELMVRLVQGLFRVRSGDKAALSEQTVAHLQRSYSAALPPDCAGKPVPLNTVCAMLSDISVPNIALFIADAFKLSSIPLEHKLISKNSFGAFLSKYSMAAELDMVLATRGLLYDERTQREDINHDAFGKPGVEPTGVHAYHVRIIRPNVAAARVQRAWRGRAARKYAQRLLWAQKKGVQADLAVVLNAQQAEPTPDGVSAKLILHTVFAPQLEMILRESQFVVPSILLRVLEKVTPLAPLKPKDLIYVTRAFDLKLPTASSGQELNILDVTAAFTPAARTTLLEDALEMMGKSKTFARQGLPIQTMLDLFKYYSCNRLVKHEMKQLGLESGDVAGQLLDFVTRQHEERVRRTAICRVEEDARFELFTRMTDFARRRRLGVKRALAAYQLRKRQSAAISLLHYKCDRDVLLHGEGGDLEKILLCQNIVKAYLTRIAFRRLALTYRSAVRIQKMWRGRCARALFNKLLDIECRRKDQAALVVQRNYRMVLNVRRLVSIRRGVKLIQALGRGGRARWALPQWRKKNRVVQRVGRALFERLHMFRLYEHKCALIMQLAWRMAKAKAEAAYMRYMLPRLRLLQRAGRATKVRVDFNVARAVGILQRVGRSYQSRVVSNVRRAVGIIQRVGRGVNVRTHFNAARARWILQRCGRAANCRVAFQLFRSARILQRLGRGLATRVHFNVERARGILQRFGRGKTARISCQLNRATRILQRFGRGKTERIRFQILRAATRISKVVRAGQDRAYLRACHALATRVQRLGRALPQRYALFLEMCRVYYLNLESTRDRYARVLQSYGRGALDRVRIRGHHSGILQSRQAVVEVVETQGLSGPMLDAISKGIWDRKVRVLDPAARALQRFGRRYIACRGLGAYAHLPIPTLERVERHARKDAEAEEPPARLLAEHGIRLYMARAWQNDKERAAREALAKRESAVIATLLDIAGFEKSCIMAVEEYAKPAAPLEELHGIATPQTQDLGAEDQPGGAGEEEAEDAGFIVGRQRKPRRSIAFDDDTTQAKAAIEAKGVVDLKQLNARGREMKERIDASAAEMKAGLPVSRHVAIDIQAAIDKQGVDIAIAEDKVIVEKGVIDDKIGVDKATINRKRVAVKSHYDIDDQKIRVDQIAVAAKKALDVKAAEAKAVVDARAAEVERKRTWTPLPGYLTGEPADDDEVKLRAVASAAAVTLQSAGRARPGRWHMVGRLTASRAATVQRMWRCHVARQRLRRVCHAAQRKDEEDTEADHRYSIAHFENAEYLRLKAFTRNAWEEELYIAGLPEGGAERAAAVAYRTARLALQGAEAPLREGYQSQEGWERAVLQNPPRAAALGVLQRLGRGKHARAVTKTAWNTALRAVCLLQRVHRGCLIRGDLADIRYAHVRTLQDIARGAMARWWTRTHWAACTIQRGWRSSEARLETRARLELRRREAAALRLTRIAKALATRLAMSVDHKERVFEFHMAARCQRAWRCAAARQERARRALERLRRRQNAAATVWQRVIRGGGGRRETKRVWAACVIQRTWRVSEAKLEFHARETLRDCCKRVTRVFRGYAARFALHRRHSTQTLQRIGKGYLLRKFASTFGLLDFSTMGSSFDRFIKVVRVVRGLQRKYYTMWAEWAKIAASRRLELLQKSQMAERLLILNEDRQRRRVMEYFNSHSRSMAMARVIQRAGRGLFHRLSVHALHQGAATLAAAFLDLKRREAVQLAEEKGTAAGILCAAIAAHTLKRWKQTAALVSYHAAVERAHRLRRYRDLQKYAALKWQRVQLTEVMRLLNRNLAVLQRTRFDAWGRWRALCEVRAACSHAAISVAAAIAVEGLRARMALKDERRGVRKQKRMLKGVVTAYSLTMLAGAVIAANTAARVHERRRRLLPGGEVALLLAKAQAALMRNRFSVWRSYIAQKRRIALAPTGSFLYAPKRGSVLGRHASLKGRNAFLPAMGGSGCGSPSAAAARAAAAAADEHDEHNASPSGSPELTWSFNVDDVDEGSPAMSTPASGKSLRAVRAKKSGRAASTSPAAAAAVTPEDLLVKETKRRAASRMQEVAAWNDLMHVFHNQKPVGSNACITRLVHDRRAINARANHPRHTVSLSTLYALQTAEERARNTVALQQQQAVCALFKISSLDDPLDPKYHMSPGAASRLAAV